MSEEKLIVPESPKGVGGILHPVWVSKGWGGELWYANDVDSEYCGKKLLIIAGKMNSWHYHEEKDEVLLVESGVLRLTYAPLTRERCCDYNWQDNISFSNRIELRPGQAFHVPATMRHRLQGLETCWLAEASTVDLPGDTVRLIKGD